MSYTFTKYSAGGGSLPPNLLTASSAVADYTAAMTAWQESGTDCGFVDGTEVCKFVAFNTNGIGYFFKGSTKQIIVVTLGAGVSIKYVDLGGSASLPPTILDASSDINAWMDAFEAFTVNGADCLFMDTDYEICRFVSLVEPSARFFKGSTNQLVVATLGESVSIQYVNIGGGGGGGGLASKTFDTFAEAVSFMLSNSYVIFRVMFVGRLRINYKPHSEAASGQVYTETWGEVMPYPGLPGYLVLKFVEPGLTAMLMGTVQDGAFGALGSFCHRGEYYNATEITSVDVSGLSDVTVYYFP